MDVGRLFALAQADLEGAVGPASAPPGMTGHPVAAAPTSRAHGQAAHGARPGHRPRPSKRPPKSRGKPAKAKPRAKQQQREWNTYMTDDSQYKLTKEELLDKKARAVSEGRVRVRWW